ncbi:MAG: ethanolamine ammonia-lyase reactivating factor EutA [Betaproteobacteria bacterium]|nr:ethanolamine ammonia-lyase reactivating factor EutA [Betaproteobacteria bacterium]
MSNGSVPGAPREGRTFFSSVRRSLEQEDEIRLTSVGVDIGSSTSHLVFSRLVLERLDNRYLVAERTILHESAVCLTPYSADTNIDAHRLGQFIEEQYRAAGLAPADIDTGALILTGVALRRSNARAIADLFAAEAGKFVAVSAGDALEATLAAFGSGAAARSIRDKCRVMNVDIGGGTSKIAVCERGEVVELTAIDIGARVISFDAEGRVDRIEPAGLRFAREAGWLVAPGEQADPAAIERMVEAMATHLFDAMSKQTVAAGTEGLLRLTPLANARAPDVVTFSGGVSEYLYQRTEAGFGDLGAALAASIRKRIDSWSARLAEPDQTIRATAVGASQYTVQVSGATIFVEPQQSLPLNNIAVISPQLPLAGEQLQPAEIAAAIRRSLLRLDLAEGSQPVALAYRWQGSASFARLDAFCRGVLDGLQAMRTHGWPTILVGEGDFGGLIGMHCLEECAVPGAIVSIDGIRLQEFDFIDIGALMETSGAVPVVIKSLVFPASDALGRPPGG